MLQPGLKTERSLDMGGELSDSLQWILNYGQNLESLRSFP